MYGELALKLVQECKRSADKLTHYNEPLVSGVISELKDLFVEVESMRRDVLGGEMTDSLNIKALLDIQSIRRNKRCLLAYHSHRVDKIKAVFWDCGKIPKTLQKNLSVLETGLFSDYAALVNEYKTYFLDLELTNSLAPPRDMYIDVRAMRDGEIQTEVGSVKLIKGGQYCLLRTDVERFITMGYLQHVT